MPALEPSVLDSIIDDSIDAETVEEASVVLVVRVLEPKADRAIQISRDLGQHCFKIHLIKGYLNVQVLLNIVMNCSFNLGHVKCFNRLRLLRDACVIIMNMCV